MPKIVKIILIIVIAIIAGTVFMFSYTGSTEPLKKVAGQLQTDASWKLKSETIEPPRIVCLGGNRCPSLHRAWDTGKHLTKTEFVAVLQRSGWNFSIEGECVPNPSAFGSPVTICSAKGVIDDLQVTIGVEGLADDQEAGQVNLSIANK